MYKEGEVIGARKTADPYLLQKSVLAGIYLLLLLATAIVTGASTMEESGHPRAASVSTWLYLNVWAIPFAILVFGLLHGLLQRSRRVCHAWLLVVVCATPAVYTAHKYSGKCEISNEIKRQFHLQLSTSEIATVTAREKVCPTFFSYIREDGKPHIITGEADFIHGTQVSFGTM